MTSSSAAATVAVATSAATTTATTPENLGEFPEFTIFVKGELFRKKGNLSKANKTYIVCTRIGIVRVE